MKEDYFFDLESNESNLEVNSDASCEDYLVSDDEHLLDDNEIVEIKAAMVKIDELKKNMKNL